MSLPMCPDNDFVKALDTAIPIDPKDCAETDQLCFRYCGAIGELIWSFPVVKLSQFSVPHLP
jgi:hypothetical protein